jgi:hypothetical protein
MSSEQEGRTADDNAADNAVRAVDDAAKAAADDPNSDDEGADESDEGYKDELPKDQFIVERILEHNSENDTSAGSTAKAIKTRGNHGPT